MSGDSREAVLVLDVARAQREVARAEHALVSCRAREYETIAELYRFQAEHNALNLNDKETDVGLVRAAMNQYDNHSYLGSFTSNNPRCSTSDGTSIKRIFIIVSLFL